MVESHLRRFFTAILAVSFAACGSGRLEAQDKTAAPPYGEFPALEAGVEMIGELIDVDPINRRGLLRPGGELMPDRYNRFLGQPFTMLPYGMVYYHGAPAELKDIPLGTVLHGVFYSPPKGDNSVPRPIPRDKVEAQRLKYFRDHTHALILEDSVSYNLRHGRAWKVDGVETNEKDGRQYLAVTSVGQKAPSSVRGPDKTGTGPLEPRQTKGPVPVLSGPLGGEQKFCIDKSTRVWKGKEFASLEDFQPGQTVQVNLTWDPNWGYGKFHVLDLWLDKQALDVAAELQRQTHIRYQRYHYLPGWVDRVTYDPSKPNGSGTVFVTLFGGMDAALYEEVSTSRSAQVAIAEPTLRTWRKDQDAQGGPLLEVKKVPNPPLGSSGIQLRIQVRHVLEGYRAGGIVRVGVPTFPDGVLPPEERARGGEDSTTEPQ